MSKFTRPDVLAATSADTGNDSQARDASAADAATTSTTSAVAASPAPAGKPVEEPAGGGSFIRQADGSLVRNPAHPELEDKLLRRPTNPDTPAA